MTEGFRIERIAGYAVITGDPAASASLYRDALGLPLEGDESYLSMMNFPVAGHFGVWSLKMAARSCFGCDDWPEEIPVPSSTVEFELEDVESLEVAAAGMRERGFHFVHGARSEPWGQIVARFMSPEGVLIGLSYAPWLHGEDLG